MGWKEAALGIGRGLLGGGNAPQYGIGDYAPGFSPMGGPMGGPQMGGPQFANPMSMAGPGLGGVPGQLNDYAMTGGEQEGGGGLGGWWGDMDGMEKAQIIAQALSTGAGVYGQHQAGKARDREFEESQRRYEEQEAERRRREEQRAAALRAFLPTTYNPGYEG